MNDGLVTSNPFDKIALAKLIRQNSKSSDYIIEPFSQAERDAILQACRNDERPTFQFWFNTGLRPGELQALEWRHIDLQNATARIELNQVAGVIMSPKTAAGLRTVDLNTEAVVALVAQKAISMARGQRVFLNQCTLGHGLRTHKSAKPHGFPSWIVQRSSTGIPIKSGTPTPQPCSWLAPTLGT